jgi:UDP-glucuronate decarboxylase
VANKAGPSKPRALVTGGAGFLGSHLCERLLSEGYRVVCMDNLRTGALENVAHLEGKADFEYVEHDVSTYIHVPGELDEVYHFASPASPKDFERIPIPILKVGALGTYNALGLALAKGARFMLASSSEVYGDPLVHPQSEDYWGNVNPIGVRGVYDEAKRYAEAITMAYRRHHGVDTRIVRIFNSILADEQILYDDGRELRREKVADLAARLASRAVAASYVPTARSGGPVLPDAGFSTAMEYPLEGYTVPSFDEGGRLVAASAIALVAHPTEERCFEVRTRYGRSVRVTGHHSIFVEGPDGEPVARFVEELQEGERVAIARRIEVPERDRTEVTMLDVWEYAEGDSWDLLVEAPGLGALAWENRRDLFGLLISERRNNGPNWRRGAWTKLIRMRETDRVPLPVLRRLGLSMSDEADVRIRSRGRSVPMPAKIQITDDLLWLLGLFVAEGCVHESPGKSAYITISCEEALLDRAEAIVRRELGLHVVRAKARDGRRPAAIFVHSKLLLHLMEMLGFESGRKRIPGWILGLPLRRLKWFIEGYREGDGVHSGKKLAKAIRHEFSCVGEELKDDLIVAFARFGLVPAVGRYNTTFKSRTGERLYPFWRLTLCNVSPWSPLEWDQGVSQKLNARITGDIVWASVTEIREVPATELVYDFAVPGLENFWAGTGVMAHNTYGPRLRTDDGRMIPNFVSQALSGRPLTVYGDGSQTRSVQYVDDLIEGTWRLMKSFEVRPVNIGNPQEHTVGEIAELVIELSGGEGGIIHEPLPEDDPRRRCPDITRARETLGWEPRVPVREGLKKTLDWFAGRSSRHEASPARR